MSEGGKGSKPRPFSVSYTKFSENWDKIFKKTQDNICADCGQLLPNPCKCEPDNSENKT